MMGLWVAHSLGPASEQVRGQLFWKFWVAAADPDAEQQQQRRTQHAEDARAVDAEDSFISVSSEQGIRWVELKRQLGATSRIRRNEFLPSLQEDRTNYCNGTAIYGKYCLSCSQADWGVSDESMHAISFAHTR